MRFYTIEVDGKEYVAVENSDNKLVTLESMGLKVSDMNDLIVQFDSLKSDIDNRLKAAAPVENYKILAPIPVPKQDAFQVSVEDALEYILGYTIINDVSARNIQLKHQQWYRGKSLDGYTPMGPCIVTADEIEDAHRLNIECFVNEEKRQSSNIACMITTVEEAISELSQGMTLKAGTIIATGTPGGVGMGFKPPKFLQSGDVIRCSIEKIGILSNVVE